MLHSLETYRCDLEISYPIEPPTKVIQLYFLIIKLYDLLLK